ncbi:hypothetical protein OCU04_007261 [Sclerotinia nivalis]|uniref:Uncharacterized protein n=1 Tax=Sclerotinia nivalis TaxID=352851 RepID=A0A9X0ALE8_9HELO|nr:hypothetical protein OCU04_007261 [Sclerotinia nivalis]
MFFASLCAKPTESNAKSKMGSNAKSANQRLGISGNSRASHYRRFINYFHKNQSGLWKGHPDEPIMNELTLRALLEVDGDPLRIVLSPKLRSTAAPKLSPLKALARPGGMLHEYKVPGLGKAQKSLGAEATGVSNVKSLMDKSQISATYDKSHDDGNTRPEPVVRIEEASPVCVDESQHVGTHPVQGD